ncbi:Uncharacterised protein [Mycobacteroides abscessus subsp. abscessus]|nr:Uncharacterised protein [Mycobacteroides abscessus subsp. abscessus]
MAKFIQQEHSPTQVLAAFEKQVVAATQLRKINLAQIQVDEVQLQYLPSQDSPMSATDLDGYYDQLMYGYQAYVAVLKALTLNFNRNSSWTFRSETTECAD